ncbi:hypothetical protein [Thaumasiovibrio subtropicus]|uniref:hypothetical protein n=1 Tax=Thaumasiovibrio subtropicus TaxID=1891207 RepID=UPI000B3505AA|nr:hypothetical protein [Thaumasiovibrio subtropicus]
MEVTELMEVTNQLESSVEKASSNMMLKPAVPVLRSVVRWMKGVNQKVSQMEQQLKELQHEQK